MENDSFTVRFIQARISKPLADFIIYYVGGMDDRELETHISQGWSLVEMLKQRPREELLLVLDTVLEKYPDIKHAVQRSRKGGTSAVKQSSLDIIKGINIGRLTAYITEKLPAQGAVLSRHSDWVKKELDAVSSLLV
jgi:hypothetical protein